MLSADIGRFNPAFTGGLIYMVASYGNEWEIYRFGGKMLPMKMFRYSMVG